MNASGAPTESAYRRFLIKGSRCHAPFHIPTGSLFFYLAARTSILRAKSRSFGGSEWLKLLSLEMHLHRMSWVGMRSFLANT